ncbi:MAG: hypothetical protein ACRDNW_00955 [Trebonia sp.]
MSERWAPHCSSSGSRRAASAATPPRRDALLVQDGQGVLQPGALLLALLAIASVAVLVGHRAN